MQHLTFSINLSKIDKQKLYKGEKGVYLNCVVFMNDEPNEYDQVGTVVQSVSEEERKAGVKGVILGNVKPMPAKESKPTQSDFDDLPF